MHIWDLEKYYNLEDKDNFITFEGEYQGNLTNAQFLLGQIELKEIGNLIIVIGKTAGHIDQSIFARTIIPKLRAMHHIRGETPEECMLIATMNIRSIVYLCMADVPEYAEYLKSCSFESVFLWHKRFLQVLEMTERPKRWLLKDPSHIGHIPEILST